MIGAVARAEEKPDFARVPRLRQRIGRWVVERDLGDPVPDVDLHGCHVASLLAAFV